nr:class I SAM-dependent methyltransferase [Sphingomonas bacterium]
MHRTDHACRHCAAPLASCVLDLGQSPVANDLIDPSVKEMRDGETYPLKIMVCDRCRLVQTVDLIDAEDLFRDDYVYFSSESTSWLRHAEDYVRAMSERFALSAGARHVEIASNDGYLLQYSRALGLDTLGVEPCGSVATAARAKGIATCQKFFSEALARELVADGGQADLVTANNVFAHVPDINDFASGIRELLKPAGVATIEVQHLLRLMQRNQFDTFYHEHFSYYSLLSAKRVFEQAGLRVFDVEELPTHGGSIRFFVCRDEADRPTSPRVASLLDEELAYGLDEDAVYLAFSQRAVALRTDLRALLGRLKDQGCRIAAYGAPAKGVTLLNYCGIGTDTIDFTVDKAASKQGKLLPGVRLPIRHPAALAVERPDYIVILPWNLTDEIVTQIGDSFDFDGSFITPMPTPRILPKVTRRAA